MKTKKFWGAILLIAFLCVAFTACGGDDDNGGGSNPGEKTLKIDGESFYCGDGSSVEQTKGNGMYIDIDAVTDMNYQVKGHNLIMHISPSTVAELRENQVFGVDDISIKEFRHLNEIVINSYRWRVVSGSFTIKTITPMEMTIQINQLEIIHKDTKAEHTIDGKAVLNSGVWDDKGLLPFSEAIVGTPEWLEND